MPAAKLKDIIAALKMANENWCAIYNPDPGWCEENEIRHE